jgi:predicted nucleotidyltransferase
MGYYNKKKGLWARIREMRKIEKAIKKSLAYAKKFEMKLSPDELWQRLISSRVYSRKKVEAAVRKMGLSLVMQERKETEKKIAEAKRILEKIAENDKNILFLGISGSVAGGKTKENDDIDVMIICKENRLWWSRAKLKIFLWKNKVKHRRAGGEEKKDEFCFNLWLGEESLLIPLSRRNIKTAMDLILLRPMINKEKIYEKFLQKNSWVKKWVATGYKNKKIEKLTKNKKDKDNFLFKKINMVMFWGQYLYMRSKMRGELVELKRAFFHRK